MRIRTALLAAALIAGSAGLAEAKRLTDQPLVDTAWLKANLGQSDLVVIDVRTQADGGGVQGFASGHIPGAQFSDYGSAGWRTEIDGVPAMLPPKAKVEALIGSLGIDKDKHVVVVPAGKNSSDFGNAARVYWTFKVLGHDAVSVLDGGYRAWTADAANPVATGPAKPVKPATFTGTLRPELLATVASVETARKSAIPLVDARPNDQYIGKSKSPVVKRFGTIPDAANVENTSFYDDKTGKFASGSEIARLLDAAGVKKDGDIVAFCNTGHWASVAWFGISEVLGNRKTTLYDGSMAEWAAEDSRPVVRKAQ
jgi:thiosulfate/3-mercaptopyruvate sulfurtransferase